MAAGVGAVANGLDAVVAAGRRSTLLAGAAAGAAADVTAPGAATGTPTCGAAGAGCANGADDGADDADSGTDVGAVGSGARAAGPVWRDLACSRAAGSA